MPKRGKRTQGSFIAGYKASVTTRIKTIRNTPGTPVWQRKDYEHIIRNEAELHTIREYIIHNPKQWDTDQENPKFHCS